MMSSDQKAQAEPVPPTKSDYSFSRSFLGSNLIKKWLMVMIAPLLPIYAISRTLQAREIRRGQKGSFYRYIFILILLYLITNWPWLISVGWITLQPFLFWFSFLIALYFHLFGRRREVPLIKQKDSFTFEVSGFRKNSITFLLLILVILLGSLNGVMLIFEILAVLLILFPRLYKFLGFISRKALILAHPVFGFLSLIPGVSLSGRWFIEESSELRTLRSAKDLIGFISSNWSPFFVLNTGVAALAIRVIFLLHGDPPIQEFGDVLTQLGLFVILTLVPLVMAVFYSWVWVWRDAELKIAFVKGSSKHPESDQNFSEETHSLIFASEPIQRIFALGFGIPAVVWLFDKWIENTKLVTDNLFVGTIGFLLVVVIFFFLTGGATIGMGVMYYRSGTHETLVNNLRHHIKREYEQDEEEFGILVGRSQIIPAGRPKFQ